MGKIKIEEKVIKDIKDLLEIDKDKIEEKEKKKVVFDGKQYTLKIPRKIADEVNIDPDKDIFVFKVISYPKKENKEPDLVIELKKNEKRS